MCLLAHLSTVSAFEMCELVLGLNSSTLMIALGNGISETLCFVKFVLIDAGFLLALYLSFNGACLARGYLTLLLKK